MKKIMKKKNTKSKRTTLAERKEMKKNRMYYAYVHYTTHLTAKVKELIKKHSISAVMCTDTYSYITDLTLEGANTVKKLMESCTLKIKNKTYKPHVQIMWMREKKEDCTHKTNTNLAKEAVAKKETITKQKKTNNPTKQKKIEKPIEVKKDEKVKQPEIKAKIKPKDHPKSKPEHSGNNKKSKQMTLAFKKY